MIELLAPAGNIEKLKIAFEYGADAAYLGWKKFSLRNLSGNFTTEELKFAKELASKLGKKIYLTLNIYPYEDDLDEIYNLLLSLKDIEPDALIVSDAGVVALSQQIVPNIPIHLSTQANSSNHLSVNFWKNLGVKRVNLARELSLSDIKSIRERSDVELEVFIHGAMCMSISGRCLLSNFLTGRASNKGECTHPCRWNYFITEETRPDEYFPIFEDERGAYIFNSKDLCGIFYLPDLISMGIDSLKIEGRMKSLYYLANVVRVYRKAIDSYYQSKDTFKVKDEWLQELNAVSNRSYTNGFFESRNTLGMQNLESSGYIRNFKFIGMVIQVNGNEMVVEARNKILKGDNCEIISKDFFNMKFKFENIYNLEGEAIDFVQPMSKFIIKGDFSDIPPYSILRSLEISPTS